MATLVHRFRASTLLQSVCVAVLAFVVYAVTHAPSLQYTDNGELTAAAVTFGVAHPTGYPLFTILGHAWSMVSTDVSWMNLLAGVWCAIAVGASYALMLDILSLLTGGVAASHRWASAATALMLGFSGLVWSQATSLEVYSLHLCLLTLTLLCVMKSLQTSADVGRWSALAGMLYGLMLANHLSSAFLAPGLLLLWMSAARKGQIRSWYVVVGPALLGVLLYAVLPLRSAQEPPINWGLVHRSLDAFLYHVKGTQFGVWLFSDRQVLKVNARIFQHVLSNAVLWAGYGALIVGLWQMLRSHRRLALGLLVLTAGNLGIALGYSIPDIESYFLPSVLVALVFSGVGLWFLAQHFASRASWLVLTLPLVALLLNYPQQDRSHHRAVEGYTEWVLAHAEPNAVIITRQWDFFCSAAWYEQTVRGTRPDVAVIDKELFRRTWYAPYLTQRYPVVMGRAQREIDAYMPLLAQFEGDGDAFIAAGLSREIQPRFVGMLNGILDRNADRPLYITQELLNDEPGFAAGWEALPAGPLIRLTRPGVPPKQRFSEAGLEKIITSLAVPRERLDSSLRDLTMMALGSTAMYHLDALADTASFRRYRQKARRLAPSHSVTSQLESTIP
ncbi:MAG: protein O-mannosyl-transferase family [Candidatus Kapaibacterium sp.]